MRDLANPIQFFEPDAQREEGPLNRRDFLRLTAAATGLAATACGGRVPLDAAMAASPRPAARVRPGDRGWPTAAQWEALSQRVGGRLRTVADPLEACRLAPGSAEAEKVARDMRNPFYVQAQAGGTESSGWIDGWVSVPSARVVEVRCAADVAAAVDFARSHHLRLVVKGGAHSYLGQSCAPDSLLVWTHGFDGVALHDAFVPRGAPLGTAPVEAVSVEAGASWLQVFDRVVVRAKRYVQGGGCTSVGVAGHLQTGGFGSYSKRFGMSAAGIIELELVTSDGQIRTVNRFQDADLFWAWKGAGAAFGIATRVTLRTPPLPDTFGSARGVIKARTDADFKALVEAFLAMYRDDLMNPHWGEQAGLEAGNRLSLALSCQGLSQTEAEKALQPLADYVAGHKALSWEKPLKVSVVPAWQQWSYARLSKVRPSPIIEDDRPGSPPGRFWWKGDAGQVSLFWAGYESAWLHQRLLEAAALPALARALVAASRLRTVALHFNKGLAGAPQAARDEVRTQMCINPIAADAFCLVIIGDGQQGRWRGVAGREPDDADLRQRAKRVSDAMRCIRAVAPDGGGYASEMSYHASDWREAAWGPHYPRLLALKERYDPVGLFVGHHYVGSERWSPDGFTPVSRLDDRSRGVDAGR